MRMNTFVGGTLLSLCAVMTLHADALDLDQAITLLKAQNLEVKAAQYDIESAQASVSQASGHHWGTLDFIQNASRSNDAGNVFGFKLTGREATFGDFGAEEFITNMTACQGGDLTACSAMYTQPPEALNYPGDRNFFQSKLQYTLPLYVGGKISAYVEAAEKMEQLKTLDRTKLLNEKIYETRKAFYDMRLLEEALNNLRTIRGNIDTLKTMTESMIDEGYAKKTDLLEVEAKRSNVSRSINQMEANEALLYHYLSFLMNQPVTAITVPGSDASMPTMANEEIVENNIDVQRAKTGLAIRESMEEVQFANYLPIIGMQAEVQTAADEIQHYALDKSSYTVGLQLKWNLFAGGADSAAYEQARIDAMKTKTQIELAKKGIALQTDKIRTEIESLDFEIEALDHELALANEIYASYEERYREQLASMSDVVIKQSQQLQKVLELLTVKNKRTERVFALEKLANGVSQ